MAKFSKAHYAMIAEMIRFSGQALPPSAYRDDYQSGQAGMLEIVKQELSDMFFEDNPRFDRARFLKACGIEEE